MSDPREPFSAGERLSPTRREPPRQPPRQPPQGPGNGKKPRKTGMLSRVAGFFVFGLYRLVFVGIIAAIIGGIAGYFVFSADLPSVDSLKHYHPPLETRIYANNFQLVSEVGSENRIYVPYDQIPPVVANAFIAAEDRLFWVNPGINPFAIIRAGLTDLTMIGSGHRPLGASTITEQVVKNMLLDNHITFATKIKEAILAVRVSQVMSKQQILTLYLNEIFLGNNSYGVAAAAQAYFDKPLSQLDIAEAASLAALPKAPTTYNPFLHPQDALQRRNFVISRMLDDGVISQAQAAAATAEPLLPHSGGTPRTVASSGYFADAVRAALAQRFDATTVNQGGLIVHTSLNPILQAAATDAVRDGLMRYDRAHDGWHGLVGHVDDPDLLSNWATDLARQTLPAGMRRGWQLGIVLQASGNAAHVGYVDAASGNSTPQTGTLPLASLLWARPRLHGYLGPRPATVADVLHPGDIVMVMPDSTGGSTLALEQIPLIQGALLSIDPRTGRVLAMVGGWSHDQSPYNRTIQAQRQPGSSVKPFVYLTAMEQGIQPDAPVLDAPFVQRLANGTVYRPGNYENNFEGPVPIFHALEQSLNLATLHLAREIGLTNIAKTFESFGIVDQMPPYYPSAIGAIDTTLWRMTTGYAELDEYGRQVTPSLIDSVTNPDGSILYQAAGQNCTNCVNGSPDQPPLSVFSGAQLADPDSVFQMITMMRGVVLRGTGQPAVAGITQPIAGKTGTTNDFNDAWFMGFSPGIVTGCWTGYDTPASLGNNQTGAEVCGPIWNAYMKVALQGQPNLDFPVPSGTTLEQTSFNGQPLTEAYKTGQVPGAQSTDGLLAGQSGLTAQDSGIPAGTPGTPGSAVPAATPAAAQPAGNNLGGLY
ncbi:MAG TPA: PBP1A family penicillin-binding protein [Acidocella sp.]|jgi:penicillin-binding protein 1A|nr:PBP1A family penicillin-binding protein [Acidocella sp.]